MNDNSGSSLNDLVLRQRTYSSNKGIRYGVEPQTIYIDVVILAYRTFDVLFCDLILT